MEGTHLNLEILGAELSWLAIWVWLGGSVFLLTPFVQCLKDETAEFLISPILSRSLLEM